MELILKKLDRMEEDMHGLKEDMHGLKEDMHGLKEDVYGLKEDVYGLKEDVYGLKGDVYGLKGDVYGLKDSQAKMESDIKALRADSRETHRRLDGLSAKVDLTWQAVSELSADSEKLDRLQKRVEIMEKKCGMIS